MPHFRLHAERDDSISFERCACDVRVRVPPPTGEGASSEDGASATREATREEEAQRCEGRGPASVPAPPPSPSTTPPTPPPLLRTTIVVRGPHAGRHILNAPAIHDRAVHHFGPSSTSCVDLGAMSFRAQVRLMSTTRVLVGAQGTAFLNALFLPRRAAVVLLIPYGVGDQMGRNFHNIALVGAPQRRLYRWHNRDVARARFHAEFSNLDGSAANNTAERREFLRLNPSPEAVWRGSWLAGFTFFMNQDTEVDMDALDLIFADARRELGV